jgi:hypothetical protein
MIDSNLTMSLNVNHVCHKSFMQLKLISRHSRSLSISTKLDYCITTFAGVNLKLIGKLQKVLNAGMRMAYGLKRRQPVSELLKKHSLL